jgi:hypothetical protein
MQNFQSESFENDSRRAVTVQVIENVLRKRRPRHVVQILPKRKFYSALRNALIEYFPLKARVRLRYFEWALCQFVFHALG